MPRGPHWAWPFAAYLLLAGAASWFQAGYLNADFIAYVTVARRTLTDPATGVTGYWSPLFSWLMMPLLAGGVDDLLAGRLILLVSGGAYLWMIGLLARRIADHRPELRIGMLTCGTIQAALWSTYLLDPDLLANALLFGYFCLTLPRSELPRPRLSFAAGLLAGTCYLAKAYMLPFCLLHMGLLHAWDYRRPRREGESPRRGLRLAFSMVCFLAGVSLIAGPWIACLSWKYGRPTFSTAGAANHANMSPQNFPHDPLWNPGLTPDYIFEPYLEPDWSPWQDGEHFIHQLRIIVRNTGNCLGLIPLWLLLLLIARGAAAWSGRRLPSELRSRLLLLLVTIGAYCGGYTMVNLEARYITPTVAPLLCLAALLLREFVLQDQSATPAAGSPRLSLTRFSVVWLVLLCSGLDWYHLARVMTAHPQSGRRDRFQVVAEELPSRPGTRLRLACNQWHDGLSVAYLADRLPDYWGTPTGPVAEGWIEQLNFREIDLYLQFSRSSGRQPDDPPTIPLADDPRWRREKTVRHPFLEDWQVEVFQRDKADERLPGR